MDVPVKVEGSSSPDSKPGVVPDTIHHQHSLSSPEEQADGKVPSPKVPQSHQADPMDEDENEDNQGQLSSPTLAAKNDEGKKGKRDSPAGDLVLDLDNGERRGKRSLKAASLAESDEDNDHKPGHHDKVEEEETDGRKRRRRGGGASDRSLTFPHHISSEGQKHFQNLERIIMRTHSKNLSSVRRVDPKLGDAVVVEHYKNGGGDVLHIFPENLPPMSKADLQQFSTSWFVFSSPSFFFVFPF